MKIKAKGPREQHAIVSRKGALFRKFIPNRWRYPKEGIHGWACNGPAIPMDEIARGTMGRIVFLLLEEHGQDEYSIGDRHGTLDAWWMNWRGKGKTHHRY